MDRLLTLFSETCIVCDVCTLKMTERSWQRDFYISACRNGILKNQTKKTTTILLHHPYILCHFANHTPYPIHSNNNHVRYTQLSHTPLCTHRLSTAHLRSFHKPYLPCSASLAFSTKPTLSMHINMPYIPSTAHFTAARAFHKPYPAAITKRHSL